MIVKTNYKCSHCGSPAYEYEGIEGGMYIGFPTTPTCDKSAGGDHDFQPVVVDEGLTLIKEMVN